MSAPLNLVAKPKASDECRSEIVAMLRRTLAEAEAGDIDTLFMIVMAPGGDWMERYGGMSRACDLIGRLEVTKQAMIQKYLDREGPR